MKKGSVDAEDEVLNGIAEAGREGRGRSGASALNKRAS